MKNLRLIKHSDHEWELPKTGTMNAAASIFSSEPLLAALEPSAMQQMANVCSLPGIVGRAMMMPDAHHGFGFPIGGVAAFDPKRGVVSAGGVGFDIGCGVRTLHTSMSREEFLTVRESLVDRLFTTIPTGAGRGGEFRLSKHEIEKLLTGGASWAVGQRLGFPEDLEYAEENGRMTEADPKQVSNTAKKRFIDQLGTLGSGNHYLEIQYVDKIFDRKKAGAFGLQKEDVVVSIHCGSRGLGHQIAKDYVALMIEQAGKHNITLLDRNLACAPIQSDLGQAYLSAMRCAINAAMANRQVITHMTREVFAEQVPHAALRLLYDVSHNTCKLEEHTVHGKRKQLYVHRKGVTRSYPPGHPALPRAYAEAGQPVLVGGSMGTPSYVLAGTAEAMQRSFGSACHGAGRALSRTQARKKAKGKDVLESLRHQNIYVRTQSVKSIAEEAPQAYKDIEAVIAATANAGQAMPVARLKPLASIKG